MTFKERFEKECTTEVMGMRTVKSGEAWELLFEALDEINEKLDHPMIETTQSGDLSFKCICKKYPGKILYYRDKNHCRDCGGLLPSMKQP